MEMVEGIKRKQKKGVMTERRKDNYGKPEYGYKENG